MQLSLTKRYALFVACVIIVLLAVSYVATYTVMREGLTDLFKKRLERAPAVVEQYSRADLLNRRKEIETIVSSPRFLAATATGDRATVAQEAPSYVTLSGADLLAIFDDQGNLMFSSDTGAAATLADIRQALTDSSRQLQPGFYQHRGDLFRILGTPVTTADGFLLGYLALGHSIQDYMPEELHRLTGFDVVVTHDHTIVGSSRSELTRRFLSQADAETTALVESNRAGTVDINGDRILYHTVPLESIAVTFIAPVDQHIAPIMKSVSSLLIGVALVIGFLSMVVIYIFTHRRIGHQVDLLVDAAKRIAADDLDFTITPASTDELGYLAREFERTRGRILENRRQLKEAHESRVKSERLATIGRLTAGIVHDIKNPMAIIGGNAEMIQRTHADDEKLLLRCSEIVSQIDRVRELTGELMEYSRGRTKLDLEQVQLAEYMTNLRGQHDESFQRAGIALSVEDSPSVTVRIDPPRFRRVIDNLLNNAREALKPGSSVSIRWQDRDNDFMLIVADNGPGIPPQILDTLFEPFVTQGKETGTGLGLAITRQIVEDHGGTIEVESIPHQGTTFTVRLPNAILDRDSTPAIPKRDQV